MVVQWLKLYTPSAGALGSIPCQATMQVYEYKITEL